MLLIRLLTLIISESLSLSDENIAQTQTHYAGTQAPTCSNLTPLQFTILSEKLAAVGYESHFVGKGENPDVFFPSPTILLNAVPAIVCRVATSLFGCKKMHSRSSSYSNVDAVICCTLGNSPGLIIFQAIAVRFCVLFYNITHISSDDGLETKNQSLFARSSLRNRTIPNYFLLL